MTPARWTELEAECLESLRAGEERPFERRGEVEDWFRFAFRFVLEAAREVRRHRMTAGFDGVAIKDDGSPATRLETRIEETLRARLAAFDPGATVVGEETGGSLPERGRAIAIDPVDGTWAFLDGTETYATTLILFRDGEPVLGVIANPSTGEVGYAWRGERTRLVRLSLLGEPDASDQLPAPSHGGRSVRVNAHPSPGAAPLVAALQEAWRRGEIVVVRSPGGSPSWALLDAARGRYTYVNLWAGASTKPYDLTAGVLLVEGAGGRVVDVRGQPIDPLRHRGAFVAGVEEASRETVRRILGAALG